MMVTRERINEIESLSFNFLAVSWNHSVVNDLLEYIRQQNAEIYRLSAIEKAGVALVDAIENHISGAAEALNGDKDE